MMDKKQPHLVLLPAERITLGNVFKMFTAMTGREPTEEEVAEARKLWDEERMGEDFPPISLAKKTEKNGRQRSRQ